MVQSVTEAMSHVHGLVEAFRAFDSDNDGSITAAELGGLMGSLGYSATEQEVRAMMREGDKDRDGLLGLDEFLAMNTEDHLGLGELGNFLADASEALTGEGDTVTGEELFQVLASLGLNFPLEDCVEIISSMDVDDDGVVSVDDFNLVVNSLL